MQKVTDVAEWFLARNNEDYATGETDELISNLKLQKLLYYAQGSVLALTGEPLFEDDICAWAHGPVVPEVYRKYKNNGSNGIPFEGGFYRNSVGEEINSILEAVYREFGQYSAWKLRNMTHKETPWLETPKNGVISKEAIKKYFLENYVE